MMTLVLLAVHIHKLTVMNVISPRAFSSGNLEVLITVQMKANTPNPINIESPAFLCQSSCSCHMIVMGRSARANSINAVQPTIIFGICRRGGHGSHLLPVNRAKSVSLSDGQHTASPLARRAVFHRLNSY